MDNYEWILTLLGVIVALIGLGGAFLAWIYGRIDKKFEFLISELKEIKLDMRSIDKRLTQLEARFQERGYWESRKTGTYDEEQK